MDPGSPGGPPVPQRVPGPAAFLTELRSENLKNGHCIAETLFGDAIPIMKNATRMNLARLIADLHRCTSM